MITLDELGLQHGTDKASSKHDYLSYYEEIFPKRSDINLLEIGVDGGASMKMWLDWFHHGQIYGIDHNLKWKMEDPRLHLFEGDVTSGQFMLEFGLAIKETRFDVIVDDGGHHTSQRLAALTYLWAVLAPGGLYVIEDMHTDYWPEYTQDLRARFIPWLMQRIDMHVNDEGIGQTGKRKAATVLSIDTVTFRKSLVVLKKLGPL